MTDYSNLEYFKSPELKSDDSDEFQITFYSPLKKDKLKVDVENSKLLKHFQVRGFKEDKDGYMYECSSDDEYKAIKYIMENLGKDEYTEIKRVEEKDQNKGKISHLPPLEINIADVFKWMDYLMIEKLEFAKFLKTNSKNTPLEPIKTTVPMSSDKITLDCVDIIRSYFTDKECEELINERILLYCDNVSISSETMEFLVDHEIANPELFRTNNRNKDDADPLVGGGNLTPIQRALVLNYDKLVKSFIPFYSVDENREYGGDSDAIPFVVKTDNLDWIKEFKLDLEDEEMWEHIMLNAISANASNYITECLKIQKKMGWEFDERYLETLLFHSITKPEFPLCKPNITLLNNNWNKIKNDDHLVGIFVKSLISAIESKNVEPLYYFGKDGKLTPKIIDFLIDDLNGLVLKEGQMVGSSEEALKYLHEQKNPQDTGCCVL
jgi:hypothetical protein